MKQYDLTVARIEPASGRIVLVVEIPWAEWEHPHAPDAYRLTFSQVDATIAIVSKRPDGKWESACLEEAIFEELTKQHPLSELHWHQMKMTSQHYPWELFDHL